MYSARDKNRVLKRLRKNGLNFIRTASELGYPSVETLKKWWLRAPEEAALTQRAEARRRSFVRKLRNPKVQLSQVTKVEALHRCYTLGESPALSYHAYLAQTR